MNALFRIFILMSFEGFALEVEEKERDMKIEDRNLGLGAFAARGSQVG